MAGVRISDHADVVIDLRRREPHDASLDPPEWLSGGDWAAFTRPDQERLIEVDKRLGGWSDDAGEREMARLRSQVSLEARQDVDDAFSEHFSDTGWSAIQGSLRFRHLQERLRHSSVAAAEVARRLEQADATLVMAAGVAQWDLYHRARAPSVVVFHGGSTPTEHRLENIRSGFTLYAGYSWTPVLDAGASFGGNFYATVLPIRHIFVSFWAPFGDAGRRLRSQHELAPRDRLVLDPAESTAFTLGEPFHELAEIFSLARAPRPGSDWSVLSNKLTAGRQARTPPKSQR